MAVDALVLAAKAVITPSPTPAALLLGRQVSSKKYEYPACRSDPNGPCALSDRAKELCSREFATWSNEGYPRAYYCRCTNGYYSRSSECWNDCYGASRTTKDVESISRDSRVKQLECESYSIQIEAQNARNSVTLFLGNQTSATTTAATSKPRVNVSIPSVGATAPANVEETAPWADRPSATGQVKPNAGARSVSRSKWSKVGCVTLVVVLMGIAGF